MDILTKFDEAHLGYWEDYDPVPTTFGAPPDLPTCEPAMALVTSGDVGGPVVRVGWKPNEIELAALAQGGTIWLSMWGGLAPHALEVQGVPA